MTLDYPIFCGSEIIRVAQSWIRVVGGQLGSFDFPGSCWCMSDYLRPDECVWDSTLFELTK